MQSDLFVIYYRALSKVSKKHSRLNKYTPEENGTLSAVVNTV